MAVVSDRKTMYEKKILELTSLMEVISNRDSTRILRALVTFADQIFFLIVNKQEYTVFLCLLNAKKSGKILVPIYRTPEIQ